MVWVILMKNFTISLSIAFMVYELKMCHHFYSFLSCMQQKNWSMSSNDGHMPIKKKKLKDISVLTKRLGKAESVTKYKTFLAY